MINVVCVLRQGGKVGYDATWVEKLKNSVSKNLTIPHRFVCLSDCEVPCDRIPLEDDGDGFWAKIQLFKPKLFNGPVLYIDLDTVICGNIDEIINAVANEKFVMWLEFDKQIHSSAMMWWQGDYSFLWNIYKSKPLSYWKTLYSSPPLYGDQALISENINHKTFLDICHSDWFHIASKKDSELTNSLLLSKIKILMFRKSSQKPSTMSEHPLVKKYWI
jgi:hypothetical protein